jgi:hypothetical protein
VTSSEDRVTITNRQAGYWTLGFPNTKQVYQPFNGGIHAIPLFLSLQNGLEVKNWLVCRSSAFIHVKATGDQTVLCSNPRLLLSGSADGSLIVRYVCAVDVNEFKVRQLFLCVFTYVFSMLFFLWKINKPVR